jgi:hypothetical protein
LEGAAEREEQDGRGEEDTDILVYLADAPDTLALHF